MSMRIRCIQCGTKLSVAEEHIGRSIRCPGCKQVMKVPLNGDAAPAKPDLASRERQQGPPQAKEEPRSTRVRPDANPARSTGVSREQGITERKSTQIASRKSDLPPRNRFERLATRTTIARFANGRGVPRILTMMMTATIDDASRAVAAARSHPRRPCSGSAWVWVARPRSAPWWSP